MRSAAACTTSLAFGLLVAGCGGGGDDLAAAARTQTLSAPYLVIAGPRGRELLLSQELTVIKRRGRVMSWTRGGVALLPHHERRCYERSTEFNRDDIRDTRASAWPGPVDGFDLDRRGPARVLSAGFGDAFDSGGTEIEIVLDRHGRVATVRRRSAEFGAVPAGRWQPSRYAYPTAAQFRRAARAPRPRCR